MPRSLPPLLERYLERCLPASPASPSKVRLRQTGEMRLAPDKPWFRFRAEQTIATKRLAFRWRARFRMAPLVRGVVEDAIDDDGHGRLEVRLWGLVPLARERGPKIDEGEAQRYLGELVWNPFAVLHNPQLRFEASSSVAVRVSAGDASVELRFDEAGDIVGVRADRYRDARREPWEGRFGDYRDLGGFRGPSRGAVGWKTDQGDFVYWRGTIEAVELVEAG